MTGGRPGADSRRIEVADRIAASPVDVWEAITTDDGLVRWLAPIASVEPGMGGSVTVAWAAGEEWTSRIAAWDEGVRLGLVDGASEGGSVPPVTLDYELEGVDGGTEIRIVNAGLPASQDWDEAFRMTTNGWAVFMQSLRHSLERHGGEGRTVVSARPWVRGTRRQVWDRLFGADDPVVSVDPAERASPSGQRSFVATLDGRAPLEGVLAFEDEPWAFAGLVSSLNDGVLHVELEGSGDRWKLGLWLSLWGVGVDECEEIQRDLDATVERAFPSPESPEESG